MVDRSREVGTAGEAGFHVGILSQALGYPSPATRVRVAPLSERWRGRLLVGLLGTLLVLSVLGANVVVGAERTVLNADFVADGLEDEDIYVELADGMAEGVQPQGATEAIGNTFDGEGPDPAAMAESVVTPAWVQGEVERNLDSAYAYLHGDTDELRLVLDTGAVKGGFAAEFETWILEADTATLDERMAQLTESQESFEQTRTNFENRQYQRIQQRTQEDLSQSELEARYDENRDAIRGELVSQLEESLAESSGPPQIRQAAVEYGTVAIDGLVTESTDYDELVNQEEQAREELATAVSGAVSARLDEEVPDSMDLTSDMDAQTLDTIETARTAVSLLDLLAIVLPVGALALAGLLGYVSRRRSNGLWRVGATVAAVGLLCAVLAWLASSMLPRLLNVESGQTPAPAEAALSMATEALGTLLTQSVLLFVVGLLLVGAGIGVRRELLPVADDPAAPVETE